MKPIKTLNNAPTDRENLEALVYLCLKDENPPITMSKGRELLGFRYMEEMREFMKTYTPNYGSPYSVFYAEKDKA